MSADNPASANMAGMKETHSALRPCRQCMVRSADLNKSFAPCLHLLRNIEEHDKHVEQVMKLKVNTPELVNVIEGPVEANEEEDEDDDYVDIEVTEEKYLDHKNPSVNFGVNSRSILADCPGFDVTKGFPQDLLHLLAEGVVELLCRKVLKDLCLPYKVPGQKKRRKALLDLKALNASIATACDLGHHNVSRPSYIEESHLKGSKLKQSGSQLLVLLHLLPFFIDKVCPPEKMHLFTTLIELKDLCMSYELSNPDRLKIEQLVQEFGTAFVRLYPNVKSLKLHAISHLAMQVMLFGPLRQQFCYRYEAMHSQFTSIADITRSKKNMAFTGASRYLTARNAQLMRGKESGSYLYEGDVVKNSTPIQVCNMPEGNRVLEKCPDLTENSTIFEATKVTKHGHDWQKGTVIIIEKNGQNSVFGRINKVFLDNDGQLIFVYNEYVTKFITTYSAFEICKCDSRLQVVKLVELLHPFPITRFSFNRGNTTVAYLLVQSPGGSL